MRSARQEEPSSQCQLAMALDSAKLRGMKPVDREAAITRLARLLI
jgi:uncharacterized protein HemX